MSAITLPLGCDLEGLLARADAPTSTICTDCHGTGFVPCDCKAPVDCPACDDDGSVRCTACRGYGDTVARDRAIAAEVWRHTPRRVQRAVLAVVAYTAANDPPVYDYAPASRPRIVVTLRATEAQRARLGAVGFRCVELAARPGVWRCTWVRR